MPPRSGAVPVSSLKITPTQSRSPLQTGEHWLKDKQKTDGAEGLWRIHDTLYDLTDFVKKHPGGQHWIATTQGTDITEAFEVHHLSALPDEILKKYHVRKATTKRNSPFTFKEDGFYRTLKREVENVIKTIPKQPSNTSAFFTDSLLVAVVLFSVLANTYWSYRLAIVAGMFLACLTISAHNYFHKRDNFRMFYFNLSTMSLTEWRISHVLSHHLHTNTINDLEISQQEPILRFLPVEKDSTYRLTSWVLFPIYCIFAFHMQFVRMIIYAIRGEVTLKWFNGIPFTLPLVMHLLGGQSLLTTMWMWNFIILVASTHFFVVGFNAAHHHPDIFHDGDTPRSDTDYDWGLSQLDALMDRRDISGSHFLVLTNFGDHALHHLFPTLDHGILEHLYPTLKMVCEKFNVDLRMASQLELIKGAFMQLIRTTPNPNPPNLLKKY